MGFKMRATLERIHGNWRPHITNKKEQAAAKEKAASNNRNMYFDEYMAGYLHPCLDYDGNPWWGCKGLATVKNIDDLLTGKSQEPVLENYEGEFELPATAAFKNSVLPFIEDGGQAGALIIAKHEGMKPTKSGKQFRSYKIFLFDDEDATPAPKVEAEVATGAMPPSELQAETDAIDELNF